MGEELRLEITGVAEFVAALRGLGEAQKAVTGIAVDKVLDRAVRQEKTQLSLGYHRPGTRTGSVPPAPPWRISGDLRASVRKQPAVCQGGGAVWLGKMGPTAVYARIQELGGRTGYQHRTVLPARPHLKPAWHIVHPQMRDMFAREWSAVIR
jgi:hypothetical protein